MAQLETTDYTITVKVPVENHMMVIGDTDICKHRATTVGEEKDYDRCCKIFTMAENKGATRKKVCNSFDEDGDKILKITFGFVEFEKLIEFKYMVSSIFSE